MQMFIKTIALLLALLFLPDIYIYFMYIVKWTKSWLWRGLFFLPTALLIIYMLSVRIGTAAGPDHQHAIGVFFIIFLCITAPKAVFFIIDGLGHLEEERKNGKKTCPHCHANWETIEKRGVTDIIYFATLVDSGASNP